MNLGKIPTSKFLPNLLVQISKALVNSKIQFLFGKDFSFAFSPIRPAASRPTQPLSPASHWPSLPQAARALGPSRPTRQWRMGQNTFPFSHCATRRRRLLRLSPTSGAHLSALSSTLCRPIPATPPLLSATPLHPASTSRCRAKLLTSLP
jgi:hypothetical protein